MQEYYTDTDTKQILIGQKLRHLGPRQLSDIPMFFIVGRPRSGTTLLRTLFDAHPNVTVPPECQFIINLYPRYGKIKNWTRKTLEVFYGELLDQWYFDLWPLNRKRLHESLMACEGGNSYSTVCKVVYQEYISVFGHGKLLAIGDKNPGYTIYTETLLKIFPEAKFIHIIRDYRDNYLSIKNVDFELPVISLTVSKWKAFVKRFRKAALKVPGRYMEIRYEDLVKEPEEKFREMCGFLDIPYSSLPFGFYREEEKALRMYPREIMKKYQSSLFNKINTARTGMWEKQLKEGEIRMADAAAGRYAELAGYDRRYSSVGLVTRIRILPGVLTARALTVATSLIDRFPYRWRMAILIKAPWMTGRMYLRLFNRKKYREVSLMMGNRKSLQQDEYLPGKGWSVQR